MSVLTYLAVIAATLGGGSGVMMACECGAPKASVRSSGKGVLREWRGTYGGVGERSQRVVRTQAEWERLWAQLRGNEVPTPPAPKVDWSREMVLAVFMGERNSGGHSVSIRNVTTGDKEIVATYEETAPSRDVITTQALTQPYHVAVIKRSDLPVRFTPAGKGTLRPGEG
jgi:hypothetical protein